MPLSRTKPVITPTTINNEGLPDGWEWVKLGEACTIVSGNTPKGLEQIKNTGEFHFYKVSDMNLDGNEVKMSVSNLKLTSEEIARLIPIEIKSVSTGTLKSLHQFIEASEHPYALRMYGGAFGLERSVTPGGKPYILMNLPYYLGTKLPKYIDWFIDNNRI